MSVLSESIECSVYILNFVSLELHQKVLRALNMFIPQPLLCRVSLHSLLISLLISVPRKRELAEQLHVAL